MPDFQKRSYAEEQMDDLNASGPIIEQTLRELETINTLLGGNHVTLNGIGKLLNRQPKVVRFSLADLGCGGGDILRLISRWSRKRGYDPMLTGIDANPHIVTEAQKHTRDPNISFESQNIFSPEFSKRRFDIVTGTLFFHHFTNDQLSNFFRQLYDQCQLGFVINDIHRHWFAYHSIKWLTAALSKSKMVQHDGPLSVLRAFKKDELIEIMQRAGITNFTIRWMWAFRWQVIAYK